MNKRANAVLLISVLVVASVGLFVMLNTTSPSATGDVPRIIRGPRIISPVLDGACGKRCLTSAQCYGKCGTCINNKCINPRDLRPVPVDPYTACRTRCAKDQNACKKAADDEWSSCMSRADTDTCESPRWEAHADCDRAFRECDSDCINLL